MPGDLAGSQISALLEAVPGITSVLRSPVADALVNMIRAGAGLGEFTKDDAQELIQYAVRRGLIGSDEGEALLQEIHNTARKRRRGGGGGGGSKVKKARRPQAKRPANPFRGGGRKKRR